ncbi:nucleoside hydrolase [Paenibacillus agaridevorans]|uniref:nucleoside hydrolase n=1 Tax=Paenibacillus agaridevorans TaxID=171404 RepID=UPI001BE421D7|nr:nucleoside hydrolase [Paenibacillus agaridevorans]
MKPVILDTDIGPDCDDAGALAILLTLADQGEADILGVMHCTSSPWGSGCISAIHTYYGRSDIAIGTLQEERFLDEAIYQKYNRYLAEHYPNPLRQGEKPEDATALYRKLLAGAAERSVVIIAIGPLINLYHLLRSESDDVHSLNGAALIKEKVEKLVVMGGAFPSGKEWNIEMHPVAAKFVVDHWPTPIVFSGYEAGADIQTGSRLFMDADADHPVRKAYELYLDGGQTRSSWDLITVLIGVRGLCGLWELEQEGWVEVKASGENKWNKGKLPGKEHSYIKMKNKKSEIESILDELLVKEIEN